MNKIILFASIISAIAIVATIAMIYSVSHSSLEIDKLDETYKIGESVTFLIKQDGCFVSCDSYKVKVFDKDDNLVWSTATTISRQESWTPKIFQSFKDVITIREYEGVTDKPGTYTVKLSNRDLEVTQAFTVIPRN